MRQGSNHDSKKELAATQQLINFKEHTTPLLSCPLALSFSLIRW